MTQLTIRDITPGFGADVEGLDPSSRLDDDDVALLRRTFDERGLLRFRGLDLPAAYQAYLASTVIGMENVAGDGKGTEDEEAYFVSNKRPGGGAPYGRLLWHSDMMWADTPFQVLTLYGLEVKPPVVPTMFTSAAYSWDTLPDELRARVESATAVHATGQQRRAADDDGELLQPIREQTRTTTKPVGNPHPRTGRTLLYVCQMMTREIEGLSEEESEELLEALFAHLYDPMRTWEHEWREGDLVMWDNLAIQHARSDVKVEGPVRTLRKVIAPKPSRADRPESPKFSKVG
jgi:alpha-ketoglutarate-dependent taurine dioxygenase